MQGLLILANDNYVFYKFCFKDVVRDVYGQFGSLLSLNQNFSYRVLKFGYVRLLGLVRQASKWQSSCCLSLIN